MFSFCLRCSTWSTGPCASAPGKNKVGLRIFFVRGNGFKTSFGKRRGGVESWIFLAWVEHLLKSFFFRHGVDWQGTGKGGREKEPPFPDIDPTGYIIMIINIVMIIMIITIISWLVDADEDVTSVPPFGGLYHCAWDKKIKRAMKTWCTHSHCNSFMPPPT